MLTIQAASYWWRRMTAVYALCMALLVILCMPVRANALTEHVFYVNQNQHVVELYYTGTWHSNDLTGATGGPTVFNGSQLTGFFDGQRQHVFYVSSGDEHIRELYYDGIWNGNDLTGDTNTPTPYLTSLTSLFDGHSEHVFYVSQDGHVRELFYNGIWNGNDLTGDTNGPSAYASSLTSFWDGSREHVFYVSYSDSHVRELYYDGIWNGNDLTGDTNGPTALCKGILRCLASFFDGHKEHVFYLSSSDGHVRELFFNGIWNGNDLTADTKGPAASGLALSGFWDGSKEHVYYISSSDDHVRDLYSNSNGTWSGQDLTAITNGSPILATSLTSFLDGLGDHVYYNNYNDGHVRELQYANGRWSGTELTGGANSWGLTSFTTP
jgi:hypothetical protein